VQFLGDTQPLLVDAPERGLLTDTFGLEGALPRLLQVRATVAGHLTQNEDRDEPAAGPQHLWTECNGSPVRIQFPASFPRQTAIIAVTACQRYRRLTGVDGYHHGDEGHDRRRVAARVVDDERRRRCDGNGDRPSPARDQRQRRDHQDQVAQGVEWARLLAGDVCRARADKDADRGDGCQDAVEPPAAPVLGSGTDPTTAQRQGTSAGRRARCTQGGDPSYIPGSTPGGKRCRSCSRNIVAGRCRWPLRYARTCERPDQGDRTCCGTPSPTRSGSARAAWPAHPCPGDRSNRAGVSTTWTRVGGAASALTRTAPPAPGEGNRAAFSYPTTFLTDDERV
jgi:hypothetical protein